MVILIDLTCLTTPLLAIPFRLASGQRVVIHFRSHLVVILIDLTCLTTPLHAPPFRLAPAQRIMPILEMARSDQKWRASIGSGEFRWEVASVDRKWRVSTECSKFRPEVTSFDRKGPPELVIRFYSRNILSDLPCAICVPLHIRGTRARCLYDS